MHYIHRGVAIVAAFGLMSGCANAPDLHLYPLPKTRAEPASKPSVEKLVVTDIIDKIACDLRNSPELRDAIADYDRMHSFAAHQFLNAPFDEKGAPPGEDTKFDNIIIVVNLTLQVDDNLLLTPNLNGITNYRASSALTYTLAGQFSGSRQRQYSTTFAIDARALLDAKLKCPGTKEGEYRPESSMRMVRGDLKLRETLAAGLNEFSQPDYIVEYRAKDTTLDNSGKLIPAFGAVIQFTLNTTITNAGPQWSLKFFKGPADKGGLLSGGRVETNKLIITFSRAKLTTSLKTCASVGAGTPKFDRQLFQAVTKGQISEEAFLAACEKERGASDAAAGVSAQNLLTTLTLQGLGPRPQ